MVPRVCGLVHNPRQVHASWGGNACEGAAQEERDCEVTPCPVECELSDWEDEGVCDRQCGTGNQMQVRRLRSDAGPHGGGLLRDSPFSNSMFFIVFPDFIQQSSHLLEYLSVFFVLIFTLPSNPFNPHFDLCRFAASSRTRPTAARARRT